MRTLRIGIVGLGGIAQKAWLPVLTNTAGWTLQGAWSPSRDKALRICESWRIPYVDSLANLASGCDAVFVTPVPQAIMPWSANFSMPASMSAWINRWRKIYVMLNGWWRWRRKKIDADGWL